MSRTVLLCFIHGFKGDDDTFQNFPLDLKKEVSQKLPDHNVESVVFPRYETKGELKQSTELFLDWFKERVMEVRKAHSEKPWPPNDRSVGVILVAHSMGGFVAADSLFSGIMTFDTPFNGLARSMFVYGAFSNYQKVSSVFNVMTALSAAPAGLSKMAMKRSAAVLPAARSTRSSWKGWQLIALRTGTVGAIAAGGVTAYIHREKIMEGVRGMRNLNKESMKEGVKEGYQSSVDALSQGLAYINRGNVGKSFEYLSEHFTFVGSLMKQQELNRRLERMGELKGVGIHNFYCSLGENGVWTGGYFVPERTFCAVIKEVEDEVQAHMSMFHPEKNEKYQSMTEEASNYVVRWFNDDSPIEDDPKFAAPPPPEPIEQPVETDADGTQIPKTEEIAKAEMAEKGDAGDESSQQQKVEGGEDGEKDHGDLPSPLDIAAAASMVPLPDDDDAAPATLQTEGGDDDEQKRTYMRYLFGVAQSAGTGLASYVPRQMPDMPNMPQMPQMPSGPSFKSFIPTQMPSMPSVNVWGRKQQQGQPESADTSEESHVATEAPNEAPTATAAPVVEPEAAK
ncbi:alpha/beta-Hydrolase [Apiospora phragmitis]|uniref:Alpha/beta-Hydrolase n=1 Tax=Apiospora phragmitis TaxID=2905665 RepID=A0ABR1U6R1_9PEZI